MIKAIGEAGAEGGVIFEHPGAGRVSETGDFFGGEVEGGFDLFFERIWIDEEVGAEVAFFGAFPLCEKSAGWRDQLVHGRRVGGDDDGAAAHGFDEVVAPALGLGRAEVE